MKYNVMSLMKTDVKYHTNGKCVVIKAKTTTEVDSDVVKPEKIKACYGNRVRIIENWDNFDTDLEVVAEVKPGVKEPVKDETKEPVKDETKETKDEVKEPVKDENKEPVKDETKKPQGKEPQGKKTQGNKTQGNKAGNSKSKTNKK